jgi:Nuclease-related domain
MQPTNQIYTSGPVSGSEAAALKTLSEELTQRGGPFLIFSNVTINDRQIDFIVVTEQRVAHLELKHLVGPIEGGVQGPWYMLSGAGSPIARIPVAGPEPDGAGESCKVRDF